MKTNLIDKLTFKELQLLVNIQANHIAKEPLIARNSTMLHKSIRKKLRAEITRRFRNIPYTEFKKIAGFGATLFFKDYREE